MRQLAILAALIPSTASAEAVDVCHRLTDDRERLICYDTISQRGAAKTNPAETDQNSGWMVDTIVDELTGKPRTVATTVSKEIIPCGGQGRAVMHARCEGGTVSIFINHGCYAPGVRTSPYGDQDMVEMKYRLDDNEAEMRWRWPDTTDRAFGTWTNKYSRYWIDALVGHERMLVRFTPYRETPVTMTFNITGADKVRKALTDACPGLADD